MTNLRVSEFLPLLYAALIAITAHFPCSFTDIWVFCGAGAVFLSLSLIFVFPFAGLLYMCIDNKYMIYFYNILDIALIQFKRYFIL